MISFSSSRMVVLKNISKVLAVETKVADGLYPSQWLKSNLAEESLQVACWRYHCGVLSLDLEDVEPWHCCVLSDDILEILEPGVVGATKTAFW